MYKRFFFVLCFVSLLILVNAQPPVFTVASDSGLIVEPSFRQYIRTGETHEFEVHVFNRSNGVPITSGITCYMHLYNKDGEHQYDGIATTVSHIFDYSFKVEAGNFTHRGTYLAKFQCNSSTLGGGNEIELTVNDYGEEITQGRATNFNASMFFMLVLFILVICGLVMSDHYIAKFSLYWVAHLMFIAGTFSVWQYNAGYSVDYVGLSAVYKIMFYVSTIAVFPMLILSLAWIIYIHTMNENVQKMMEKGMSPEEAFKMSSKKKKGWFYGN